MNKSMLLKEAIALLNKIPEDKMPQALEAVKAMIVSLASMVPSMTPEEYQIYLDSVPDDEEELTPEEIAAIDEGEKAFNEGRTYSWEETRKELESRVSDHTCHCNSAEERCLSLNIKPLMGKNSELMKGYMP